MKTSFLLAFALLVTNFCSTTGAAPGSIHFTGADISQALELYRDLTGVKLVVDSRVTKTGRMVAITAGASGKEEAAKLIEKALLEQTGTVITRLDQERASVTYNDALPITPAKKASGKSKSGN